LLASDLSAADYEYLGGPHPILARDEAKYVGEPVALVLAESQIQAKLGAEKVEVFYTPLPSINTLTEARDFYRAGDGEVCLAEYELTCGDPEGALLSSYKVYDDVYYSPTAQHVALEPHVCFASFDGRRLDVTSATQSPYIVRKTL